MQHRTTERPITPLESLFNEPKCKRHGISFIYAHFTKHSKIKTSNQNHAFKTQIFKT